MLWNPGQLPLDWTVERLTQKHSSHPFKPDVANAFFRAGMIEACGRGYERIMSACRAAGVPAPRLRYEQTALWVEFAYRTPESRTRKTREKTREKILALIASNPSVTTGELADQVGVNVKDMRCPAATSATGRTVIGIAR